MKKIITFITIALFALSVLPVAAMTAPPMATVFNPATGHRKVVEVGSPYAFDGGYILEVAYGYMEEDLIGYSVASGYDKRTSRSLAKTASTIYVTSTKSPDDHQFVMSDFGSVVFLTIEPTGSKKENAMCTGVTPTTWTGCTRGLAFWGTSTAAVTANQKTHSAGSRIIMSNVHYVYEQLVDKDTTETITGAKTYTARHVVRSPLADNEAANKVYVDNVAIQAGASSSDTTFGLSRAGTQAEIASSYNNTNQPTYVHTKWASSSDDVNGQYVVVTQSDGDINKNKLPLDENLTFSGGNSFTGDNDFSTNGTTTIGIASTSNFYLNNINADNLAGGTTTDASDLHYHPSECWVKQTSVAKNITGDISFTHNLGIAPTSIDLYIAASFDEYCTSGGFYGVNGLGTVTKGSSYRYDGAGNGAGGSANLMYCKDGSGDSISGNIAFNGATTTVLNITVNANVGSIDRYFTMKFCK